MLAIHAKCDPRRDLCDRSVGLACSSDAYTCLYATTTSSTVQTSTIASIVQDASSTDADSAGGGNVGLYAAIAGMFLVVVVAVGFAIVWRRKSQQQMVTHDATATTAHNPAYNGPASGTAAADAELYEESYEEMGPAPSTATASGLASNNHYDVGVPLQQPVQQPYAADATYEEVVGNLSSQYALGGGAAADDATYEDVENNSGDEHEC